MSLEYGLDLWKRAVNALKSAEALLSVSADDAALRAYYAAFHAVMVGKNMYRNMMLKMLFMPQEKFFKISNELILN